MKTMYREIRRAGMLSWRTGLIEYEGEVEASRVVTERAQYSFFFFLLDKVTVMTRLASRRQVSGILTAEAYSLPRERPFSDWDCLPPDAKRAETI